MLLSSILSIISTGLLIYKCVCAIVGHYILTVYPLPLIVILGAEVEPSKVVFIELTYNTPLSITSKLAEWSYAGAVVFFECIKSSAFSPYISTSFAILKVGEAKTFVTGARVIKISLTLGSVVPPPPYSSAVILVSADVSRRLKSA